LLPDGSESPEHKRWAGGICYRETTPVAERVFFVGLSCRQDPEPERRREGRTTTAWRKKWLMQGLRKAAEAKPRRGRGQLGMREGPWPFIYTEPPLKKIYTEPGPEPYELEEREGVLPGWLGLRRVTAGADLLWIMDFLFF
jgi:hypothetical protein